MDPRTTSMAPAMEPQDLASRAAAGDARAFLTLVQELAAPLQLYIAKQARGVLGADVDADDLLQATLCKAWELMPSFASNGAGSFYRWLVTIAGNQIGNRVQYVRVAGRQDVRSLASASGDAQALALADSMTSVASQAARREAVARAEAALARMPDSERTLVELTYLEGLSIRDAAEQAGLPRSTAFRLLQAGMARLRAAVLPPRSDA